MAYVQGFSRMVGGLADAQDCDTGSETSPSDAMLNYLRRNGASVVCLFHNGTTKELRSRNAKAPRTDVGEGIVPGEEVLTSVSVTTDEGVSLEMEENMPLEVSETAEFKEYARKSRYAVGATDDQDILIACCWVLPSGRRLFRAFPEVVGVDGTHETNNEGRPLLTLSVKDSNGNVIVVVRCFAPNERSWLFRWLFQEAIPVLLGKDTLQLVKLIMTDGDSQEMTQVDYAIDRFFVNAIRTRCGWHLVHQGWRRECRGLGFRKGKRAAARRQVRVIQNWLYSWMRRGVDSKEEYDM
jgi:MULE transposase domain